MPGHNSHTTFTIFGHFNLSALLCQEIFGNIPSSGASYRGSAISINMMLCPKKPYYKKELVKGVSTELNYASSVDGVDGLVAVVPDTY